MKYVLGFVVSLSLLLVGCQRYTAEHPLLEDTPAGALQSFSSFDEYVAQTRTQLRDYRYFLTADQQQEVRANLPFELLSETPAGEGQRKGVLLIHGLGDSPWSFVDIGQALKNQGYRVRTVLLPGHGTRPGDMLSADMKDWQALVAQQVALMQQEVDQLYLGGFSTGGNLAYLHAANDPSIAGLMLFSPGFKSDESMIGLTPLLAKFKRWLLVGDGLDRVTNYARYSAMPTNGFVQYYYTSRAALAQLKDKPFTRPVFMVLSEDDSVLDSRGIRDLFIRRFTHPQSRLIWFASMDKSPRHRQVLMDARVPGMRISNMSHMGVLFAPTNPYYGRAGSERICRNGQENPDAQTGCEQGKPVWYSAWGYQEEDKYHARLTFNPRFTQMMGVLKTVFESSTLSSL